MDYPSNSRASQHAPKEEPEKEKVEKVVSGNVIKRKKPLGKRFREVFIGEDDTGGVWNYVLLDVVVPNLKDLLADVVNTATERTLFGGSRNSPRRSRGGAGNTTINYANRYANTRPADRDSGRVISRRGRATHNFEEIIFETRGEAEEVLDRMSLLLEKYHQVLISDLYNLTGISSSHADLKWGWRDLRGTRVERLRGGGYLLDLPEPESLDR